MKVLPPQPLIGWNGRLKGAGSHGQCKVGVISSHDIDESLTIEADPATDEAGPEDHLAARVELQDPPGIRNRGQGSGGGGERTRSVDVGGARRIQG